jgi:hypothetical protein
MDPIAAAKKQLSDAAQRDEQHVRSWHGVDAAEHCSHVVWKSEELEKQGDGSVRPSKTAIGDPEENKTLADRVLPAQSAHAR